MQMVKSAKDVAGNKLLSSPSSVFYSRTFHGCVTVLGIAFFSYNAQGSRVAKPELQSKFKYFHL